LLIRLLFHFNFFEIDLCGIVIVKRLMLPQIVVAIEEAAEPLLAFPDIPIAVQIDSQKEVVIAIGTRKFRHYVLR
jgi:hypothetical protein